MNGAQKQNGEITVPTQISLKGQWHFRLDILNAGIKEKWFKQNLPDVINLPGTTDEQKKGCLNLKKEIGRLTRVYPYYGPAWYQKELEIPKEWLGKHIVFSMERTKTSWVWVDEKFVSKQNSLTTAHQYDLSQLLTPGKHRLTVCINNADNPPVGDPHQISDQTQTNWNGILGEIKLEVNDQVWIKDVQVYPDVAHKKIDIKILFNTHCKGTLNLSANAWNTRVAHVVKSEKHSFATSTDGYYETLLAMGDSVQFWDEFSPALYRLKIDFKGEFNCKKVCDHKEVNFGMRSFTAKGTQFQVNGKTIFLRGKHDACVFPITGYAPMDVDEWIRVFKIAKSYGINHYRYHTWCPPKAAFEAADIVGIYMQPELPLWGQLGKTTKKVDGDVELRIDNSPEAQRYKYLLREGQFIMKAFGNYASFCMFGLGNELNGDRALMGTMIDTLRKIDSRHLYAQGSNNFLNEPRLSPGDDYWTTTFTGGHYSVGHYFPDTKGLDVRSSYPVHTVGHINNNPPSTDYDYTNSIKGIPVPVIGHEIGQFQVYPNFKEIEKYTGVVQARNFEIYRDRLKTAGMLEQADDFFRASGALAVLCYREDIETALRTPGFGGFQLLDLQDFPGQGTALVGILDAFMDSKGLITPQNWQQFCSAVVPLARMKKYTWTNDELFSANIEIANYGSSGIKENQLNWSLTEASSKQIDAGKLSVNIPQGKLSPLGSIVIDLSKIVIPQKLELTLSLDGTNIKNSYPIWVYPAKVDNTYPSDITVSGKLSEEVIQKLQKGGSVLLLPDSASLKKQISGAFQSDFWCYPMFKKYNPPGTLGILCDPNHPIFRNFPTEFHSNWQWWSLLKNGQVMILDKAPEGFKPLVQVIDNFERNHKLGTIIECQVGKGRLIVCSFNLLKQQDKPEARQLLQSILKYMESDKFKPAQVLDIEFLKDFLMY
jgi:hypothetical protein